MFVCSIFFKLEKPDFIFQFSKKIYPTLLRMAQNTNTIQGLISLKTTTSKQKMMECKILDEDVEGDEEVKNTRNNNVNNTNNNNNDIQYQ